MKLTPTPKITLGIALAGCIWAQSGLSRPEIGIMVGPAGRAQPVFGTAGSLTLGKTAVAGVVSSACSSAFCIFKKRSAIVAGGHEVNAPKGPAFFALDGRRAYIYFPESHQLALWHDSQLDFQKFSDPGGIVSLGMGAGGLEFAVRDARGISIVDSQGAVLDSAPGATGPALLLNGGILYATSDELVLRRPDESEMRWPIASIRNFSAMGDNYVQFTAGRSIYAIRTDAGHERVFRLPVPGL